MDISSLLNNFSNYDCHKIASCYSQAIKIKASNKKKSSQELIELDKWMQNDLNISINKRSKPHVNLEELKKLMEWKLSRGKWRPRLLQLAGSNSPESVIDTTTLAIQSAKKNKIEEAITTLCNLKGVGPATASAILAVAVPSRCAFYADEVAQYFAKEKLKYSLKEYLDFNKQIYKISHSLNEEDNGKSWTPHKVELMLWTHSLLKSDASYLDNISKAKDTDQPPKKKLKS